MEETKMAHTYVKTSIGNIYDLEKIDPKHIRGERIVRQTNILEDFLDEFIVCEKGCKCLVDLDFDTMTRKYLYRILDHDEWKEFDGRVLIVGAVWKGMNLESVAKLKEDGEWEVL